MSTMCSLRKNFYNRANIHRNSMATIMDSASCPKLTAKAWGGYLLKNKYCYNKFSYQTSCF